MDTKLGFEAAGGMVEKFLPGISFPVLMNAVLPGVLAVGALSRVLPFDLSKILSGKLEDNWLPIALLVVSVATLGGLVSALNSQFYELYEGRVWPRPFFELGKRIQQWKVDRLYARLKKLKNDTAKESAEQQQNEIWYKLRLFPIETSNGMRYASHPTLLGNLLYGYEDYPRDRYGMDAVFYWPRLWLSIDKDTRAEVSQAWALADGLLNLSGTAFLAGVLWLVALLGALSHLWGWNHAPLKSATSTNLLWTAAWFVLSYLLYRISLPFHRSNGEVFKSLFDIYRDKLSKMTSLQPNEKLLWRAAWAYLQYLKVRCPSCKTGYVSVYSDQCSNDKCPGVTHAAVKDALAELNSTGALVYDADAPDAETVCRTTLAQLLKLLSDLAPKDPKS